MDLAEAQRRIDAVSWYHEFDFPNGLQARSNESVEAHRTLWTFIERELDRVAFTGKTVLDIGCWDGYWSFYVERRGATRVLATDDRSQNWAGSRGLLLARELLGSQIETRLDVSIYQLDVLEETFDVILCLGVYYHLLDPFYAFAQIRRRCHPNTLVLIEGDVSEGLAENAILCDPSNHARPIFLPSISALNKMLKAAYLDVVSQDRMVQLRPESWRRRLKEKIWSGISRRSSKTESVDDGLSSVCRHQRLSPLPATVWPALLRRPLQGRIRLMTRPVAEYTIADWRRLRPIIHFIKSRRYQWIDAVYSRRGARQGNAAELAGMMRGKRALIPIAYNDPQAIEWQSRLLRAFVPDALYLIADNSTDDSAAAHIASLARQQGIPYVRLPAITWTRAYASRSHGLALNWVWRNIVRPGKPEAFGFLDQDLFPTAPDDPFAELAQQDFYGFVRRAGDRWFLWAGFCLFRFEAIKDRPLDFGQDWFKGLDTGGRNWDVLYRAVDLGKLRSPPAEAFPFEPGSVVPEAQFQRFGAWLHEVGVRGNEKLRTEKRRALERMLRPLLEQC